MSMNPPCHVSSSQEKEVILPPNFGEVLTVFPNSAKLFFLIIQGIQSFTCTCPFWPPGVSLLPFHSVCEEKSSSQRGTHGPDER